MVLLTGLIQNQDQSVFHQFILSTIYKQGIPLMLHTVLRFFMEIILILSRIYRIDPYHKFQYLYSKS